METVVIDITDFEESEIQTLHQMWEYMKTGEFEDNSHCELDVVLIEKFAIKKSLYYKFKKYLSANNYIKPYSDDGKLIDVDEIYGFDFTVLNEYNKKIQKMESVMDLIPTRHIRSKNNRDDLTTFKDTHLKELNSLFENSKKKNKPLIYQSGNEKTMHIQKFCIWLEKGGYLINQDRIDDGWVCAFINDKGKALNFKEEYERQFFEAAPSMKKILDNASRGVNVNINLTGGVMNNNMPINSSNSNQINRVEPQQIPSDAAWYKKHKDLVEVIIGVVSIAVALFTWYFAK
jgi:hypothetical protein